MLIDWSESDHDGGHVNLDISYRSTVETGKPDACIVELEIFLGQCVLAQPSSDFAASSSRSVCNIRVNPLVPPSLQRSSGSPINTDLDAEPDWDTKNMTQSGHFLLSTLSDQLLRSSLNESHERDGSMVQQAPHELKIVWNFDDDIARDPAEFTALTLLPQGFVPKQCSYYLVGERRAPLVEWRALIASLQPLLESRVKLQLICTSQKIADWLKSMGASLLGEVVCDPVACSTFAIRKKSC